MRYNFAVPLPDSTSENVLRRVVARAVLLEPGEGKPLILSALYFFLVLFSYYLLRPIRDTFGIRGDLENLPWLWTGTSLAMLGATPVFAWMVSRMPRRRFIPLTYRFFAANIVGFYAALTLLPHEWHTGIGYAFYIWLSVFNLFAISVFWGFMADLYRLEQSKRLFAAIAVGGTLGAIAGSAVPAFIVKQLTTAIGLSGDASALHLMVLAAVTLELAVWCVRRLALQGFRDGEQRGLETHREPTRRVLAGFVLIARSPYLQLLCFYMLFFTITTTFLTFEQLRLVKSLFASSDERTAAFAQMDLAANALALFTQLFVTGRLVRSLGVGAGLLLLPVLTLAGFAALWIGPEAGWPMLGVFTAFYVSRRGLHFAVDRPSREMLYTPLSADAKYKSKSFIDTFVYRGGDLLGAWAQAIKVVAANASPIAIGACALWIGVAACLGVMNRREARATDASAPR